MDVWQTLFAFPAVVTVVPFCIFLVLLVFSVFTGLFDDVFPGLDFNADAELPNLLLPIGITKIPLVISLPLVFFLASGQLLLFSYWLMPLLSAWSFYALSAVAILVSCYVSLYIAAWMLRPLAPLFDHTHTYAKIDYIGMSGRVRTTRVDAHFGEVVVTRGSVENQLDVYCDEKEQLSYGDEVHILFFNVATRRYFITKQVSAVSIQPSH